MNYAVIVAGGTGSRYGGELPKQFMDFLGKPLVWWSMKAFHDENPDTRIVLVLHPDFIQLWRELYSALDENDRIDHEIVPGGDSRTASVSHGIAGIPVADDVLIAVHDAARPLVTPDLIRRGWEAARLGGAAVPVVPVTDSLRKVSSGRNEAVDRSLYVAVQTPQVFKSEVLKSSYLGKSPGTYTDDASVTEAAGHQTFLYEGFPHNMKITNKGDLEIAAMLLQS